MTVVVNGSPVELRSGATLAEALAFAGILPAGGVAVAVEGEVVPRRAWGFTMLRDGQAIEVVGAVQGG